MIELNTTGLLSTWGEFKLRPLKKTDYKNFAKFLFEKEQEIISLEEFLELYYSKDFIFFKEGKVWLYFLIEEEIVGYVEIFPKNKNSFTIGYFLQKSKRGSGKSTIMMRLAIAICKNLKIQTLQIEIEPGNIISENLAKKMKFQKNEECDTLYTINLCEKCEVREKNVSIY